MNDHECPSCGRPTRDGTTPSPPAPPRSPALDQTQTRVDRAQRAYDDARAAWERAASEQHAAESRGSQSIVVDGWDLREVGGTPPAQLAAMAEAERSARERMNTAGATRVEAQAAHRTALAVARVAMIS